LGYEIFYETNDQHIGSMARGRWHEVGKLLPLLIDYVNRAMTLDWRPATAPAPLAFDLANMLSLEHVSQDEIYISAASEWGRLFNWCSLLKGRDGAYDLYDPLVLRLRQMLEQVVPLSE
jgi:hypothetical protein